MPIVYPTEEMEALETLECGCAILGWDENTVFDIEYCPIHEAAPALLEACDLAYRWLKVGPDDPLAKGVSLMELIDKLGQVLAAWRGQPTGEPEGEE